MLIRILVVLALSSAGFCQRTINHSTSTIVGGPVTCGRYDSSLNSAGILPPNYTTWVPVAVGVTYTDPYFGCQILRLEDGRTEAFARGVQHEYAEVYANNRDDTLILLFGISGYRIRDLSRTMIKDFGTLPFTGTGDGPRWSSKVGEERCIYFTKNRIIQKTCIGSVNPYTATTTTVKDYSSECVTYADIGGQGEGEMSDDGDHFPFYCDGKIGLFTVSTASHGTLLDTAGVGCTSNANFLMPSNKVLIGWNCNGTTRFTGTELFDTNMNFLRQLYQNAPHHAQGYDPNGNEGMYGDAQEVELGSSFNPCGGGQHDGIAFVKASDASAVCILDSHCFCWAWHVAASTNGWILISTYDVAASSFSQINSRLPNDYSTTWGTAIRKYNNEVVLIDARPGTTWPPSTTQIRRVAHTRGRPYIDATTFDYWALPRASISRSGKYGVFDAFQTPDANTGSNGGDPYLIRFNP